MIFDATQTDNTEDLELLSSAKPNILTPTYQTIPHESPKCPLVRIREMKGFCRERLGGQKPTL